MSAFYHEIQDISIISYAIITPITHINPIFNALSFGIKFVIDAV
jgi:hypothetical protein